MKKSLVTTLLLLLLAHPSDLSSCGPFFSVAVFTRAGMPDNETEFFEGKFGILRSTLWRAYLAMAYRRLNGLPMSREQAESVGQERAPAETSAQTDPLHIWLEQRMKVPGAKPLQVEQYRTGANYQSFAGCGNDAFLTAAKTLSALLHEPGNEAEDWLAAQDQVFSNCSKKGTIPDAPPAGSSAPVVADRAYQVAAAYFYQDDWDEAKSRFQQIAADQSSPWHTIAPYLLARMDLRRELYPAAVAELKNIVEDPKLAPIHRQSRELLEYAEARTDPAGYMAFCAKQLVDPHPADLAHSLHDYTFLYDKFKNGGIEKNAGYRPEDLNELAAKDDLTAWIESFGTESAVKKWEENPSLPWLVSALSYTGPSQASPALMEAALKIPSTSSAYATARFEAVRILTDANKRDEARAALQEAEPRMKDFPLSAQNAFRAEHMQLARNFDEFLSYAPRTLVAQTYDDDEPGSIADRFEQPPLSFFDRDATGIFNNDLPLRDWLTAARDAELSPILRTQIAQAGFVRALLLKDSIAADFAEELKSLKPSYSQGLAEYLSAPPDQRAFTATFWMLHHPELNAWLRSGFQRETKDAHIDDLRDNWWCDEKQPNAWSYIKGRQPPNADSAKPEFVSKTESGQATAEDANVVAASGAPAYLSTVVVSWAQTHPDDPRVPEALALAVRSSRFGCTDAGSEQPVSEAFHILHQRFPNSPWAKRTPYWYK
jgi:hypothetical protein